MSRKQHYECDFFAAIYKDMVNASGMTEGKDVEEEKRTKEKIN